MKRLTLPDSDDYQTAIRIQESLVQEALDELDEYCAKNSWLNEIHLFCASWQHDDSVEEWRGRAAFALEVGS